MSILIVRHGFSEANNRANVRDLAFDSFRAPLMPLGREQARHVGARLAGEFGIIVEEEKVAISKLKELSWRFWGFRSAVKIPLHEPSLVFLAHASV